MFRKSLIALAALALAVSAAHASNAVTVGKLLQLCNAASDSTDSFYCFGFISGVGGVLQVQSHLVDENMNPVPNKTKTCIPEFITSDQLVQVFRNWAERNPKDWSWAATVGVMNALNETWPCK